MITAALILGMAFGDLSSGLVILLIWTFAADVVLAVLFGDDK